MKKLFLASYSRNVVDNVMPLLPKAPRQLKLIFIPTARDPYNLDKNLVDYEKEKLISLGFKVREVDIKNKSKDQLRELLFDCDVIFIAGGNTFYLLQESIKSGFNELIVEMINKGVIYIGSSAGAVIAGPDISLVKELDDIGQAPDLNTYKGFGLVDFIILPHYANEFYGEKVQEILNNNMDNTYKIIPLTDDEAVIVEDHSIQFVKNKLNSSCI